MMGARGEPWQIMYSNVTKVLERTVFLHKYPFTVKETLDGLLPPHMETFEWRNLKQAIRWERYSQFRIHDEGGQPVLFWVAEKKDGLSHPTPVDNDAGFMIPVPHPRFTGIREWAVGASELDDWVSGAKVYLNRVLKTMKHPMWVERFWPELVPFVGSVPEVLVKGMREPRPTSLQLDKALQDEIQNKLTLASLLPKDQELFAWVGRYHA